MVRVGQVGTLSVQFLRLVVDKALGCHAVAGSGSVKRNHDANIQRNHFIVYHFKTLGVRRKEDHEI